MRDVAAVSGSCETVETCGVMAADICVAAGACRGSDVDCCVTIVAGACRGKDVVDCKDGCCDEVEVGGGCCTASLAG